ncbi:hypothetical protein P7C73_g5454, partial [Tremellales sp. Uapishka_1]
MTNPSASTTNLVPPGTFASLQPTLDALLEIIHAQSVSPKGASQSEAAEAVAAKAKEMNGLLVEMKKAAMNLPGGHLSTDQIDHLSAVLEDEAERRRVILRTFAQSSMPTAETLAAQAKDKEVEDGGSAMPSPKT